MYDSSTPVKRLQSEFFVHLSHSPLTSVPHQYISGNLILPLIKHHAHTASTINTSKKLNTKLPPNTTE